VICERCSWPVGYGCTCPADQVVARQRWREVQRRHRDAVERARLTDHWQRLRAERAERKAS